VFLDAVRRDPSVFIEYCGDFSELPARCGPAAELEFELAKIAFYAYSVDRNEVDVEELQEAVHELLARYGGDPSVRARLFEIARLRAIASYSPAGPGRLRVRARSRSRRRARPRRRAPDPRRARALRDRPAMTARSGAQGGARA
jgi:hypothetical protein